MTFTDVSGYTHSAYSPPGWLYGFVYGSNPEGTNAPWYHLAGVSDGFTVWRKFVSSMAQGPT